MNRTKTTLTLAALLAVLAAPAVLLVGCGGEGPRLGRAKTYVCPMHPEIVKDHEGDCPICGMRLVPKEAARPRRPRRTRRGSARCTRRS